MRFRPEYVQPDAEHEVAPATCDRDVALTKSPSDSRRAVSPRSETDPRVRFGDQWGPLTATFGRHQWTTVANRHAV